MAVKVKNSPFPQRRQSEAHYIWLSHTGLRLVDKGVAERGGTGGGCPGAPGFPRFQAGWKSTFMRVPEAWLEVNVYAGLGALAIPYGSRARS